MSGTAEAEPTSAGRRPMWQAVAIAAFTAIVAGVAGGLIVVAFQDHDGDGDGSAHVCDAESIASDILPSVVTIRVQGAGGAGSGSGEVNRPGYILTNNHVISSAATGGQIAVIFSDGTSVPAHIVGRDTSTDLAVLKVEGEHDRPVIEWGDSDQVSRGRPVVALGAPLGFSSTVTSGIVSGLDRSVNVPADGDKTALLVAAIQTDAAINPGNSGGALVDCSGALIGVPTAGATVPNPAGGTSVGNIGIGFAIPSNFAHRIADELISEGSVTHASFGLAVAGSQAGPAGAGLYVTSTTPGGPAAVAGIRAGDVIVELDGSSAASADQLQGLTLTRRPGETVRISVERDGERHDVEVTLGEQPSR